jgi:hypothetical protein
MSKISELSDGGVIQGGDTLIAVRSGGNVKVTYGGSTTANIDGGTIDGTVIGGTTPAAVTGTTITGTSFVSSGDMTFGDSDKAIFGAGSDLQIYHTGSNSYIKDAGAGALIQLTNSWNLNNAADTQNMITATEGGDARLFYSGAGKLATTATGIDVTGTATADKVTIGTSSASNAKLTLEGVDGGDSAGIYFNNTTATNGKSYSLSSGNSGEFMLYDRTSSAYRLFVSSAGNISFYEDTGTTAKFFWDASAQRLDVQAVGADAADSTVLRLSQNNFSTGGTTLVKIGTEGTTWSKGAIGFERTGDFDKGALIFCTNNTTSSADVTSADERMRIDSSGNLAVANGNQTAATVSSRIMFGNKGTFTDSGVGRAEICGVSEGALWYSGTALAFYTNPGPDVTGTAPVERMRIDSSGNVGIGSSGALTSTYLSKAFVYTAGGANFAIGGSSNTNDAVLSRFTSFNISNSNSGNQDSANFFGVTSIESIVVTTDSNAGDDSGGSLLFKTKPEAGALQESMRIDSSGNLLVGRSSAGAAATDNGHVFYGSGQHYIFSNATECVRFYETSGSGQQVGSISITSSATAFNTSSDERLKENITDAPAGNVDDIKVRSFDWKADGSHQDYGMVAQELEAVAPYAVTKGETEDDMWSVDYSKLVPMLIKEIQDLKAEVAALKGAN